MLLFRAGPLGDAKTLLCTALRFYYGIRLLLLLSLELFMVLSYLDPRSYFDVAPSLFNYNTGICFTERRSRGRRGISKACDFGVALGEYLVVRRSVRGFRGKTDLCI